MKKNIVLISGALATPKLWQYQATSFQGQAHFFYVDVLNCLSIVDMAKRFAKIAHEPFILIGFSMGGYIALELFQYIPEKILQLVLINSAAKKVSKQGQIERERSRTLVAKGKFDFLVKKIFQKSVHDSNKYRTLLPLLQTMAHEVGAQNYISQLNAILNKGDQTPLLSMITCPTLLIASKQDKIMPPEQSEHMAACIKKSTVVHIEECGHLSPLEKPVIVNQILLNWIF